MKIRNRANYILLAVSVIVTLLLIEVGFRVFAYHNDTQLAASIGLESPNVFKEKDVSMGQIIRPSLNPRIIYELIPNLSVQFVNQPVSINSSGFRGELIPAEKPPHTIRIIGIGDSVMFGWGVKDHETYLALLQSKLNANLKKFSWEVINTAVPGYNTVMEVETLKQKGLLYKPDIVILNYVGNDTDLPNFINEPEDYFALDESFCIKYFNNRSLRSIELKKAPVKFQEKRFENNPHRVPQRYKGMVGKDAVRRAMEELSSLSQTHGFEVIVLSHRYYPEWVKKMCEELNFHIIETGPEWQKYSIAQKIKDPEKIWRLNEKDPHPSVIGHQFMSNLLFNYIKGCGIVHELLRGA